MRVLIYYPLLKFKSQFVYYIINKIFGNNAIGREYYI